MNALYMWGEGRYRLFVISSWTTSCSIRRRSPTFWTYYLSVKSGSKMLCKYWFLCNVYHEDITL